MRIKLTMLSTSAQKEVVHYASLSLDRPMTSLASIGLPIPQVHHHHWIRWPLLTFCDIWVTSRNKNSDKLKSLNRSVTSLYESSNQINNIFLYFFLFFLFFFVFEMMNKISKLSNVRNFYKSLISYCELMR